jgi:hypothetical protein
MKEWIRKAHGRSMMVEKELDEIGRMVRPKKQSEDGVKSRKVGTGRGGRGRDRRMPRNVEEYLGGWVRLEVA